MYREKKKKLSPFATGLGELSEQPPSASICFYFLLIYNCLSWCFFSYTSPISQFLLSLVLLHSCCLSFLPPFWSSFLLLVITSVTHSAPTSFQLLFASCLSWLSKLRWVVWVGWSRALVFLLACAIEGDTHQGLCQQISTDADGRWKAPWPWGL